MWLAALGHAKAVSSLLDPDSELCYAEAAARGRWVSYPCSAVQVGVDR
jgi:hypothetical protein